MANKVMIKDWEEPMKFGWRLATMDEMKTNHNFVQQMPEVEGITKIFLSDGSWDLGARTHGSRHEMKVLLFLNKAPEFNIMHRREYSEKIDQLGWRIACVDEVEQYKDTVQALIERKGCTQVFLSDGWADCDGSNVRDKRQSIDKRQGIEHALLIETPTTERQDTAHDKPSAHQATTSGKNTGGSLSVKEAKTSKKNAAKESDRKPAK